MTSLRYGGTDFTVERDTLYFSSMTRSGLALFRTALSDLRPVEVDPAKVHSYPVADILTAQEEALAAAAPAAEPSVPGRNGKPYRKLFHLMKFHSWAPLYINYDAVEDLSMDLSFDTASPGLIGFFQNELGTMGGYVGYSAVPTKDGWRHSGHVKMTYSGLYPVIEASLNVNDRKRYLYSYNETNYSDMVIVPATTGRVTDTPLVNGSLKMYIPWNFSKGGLQRGLIPQVTLSLSNDLYRTGTLVKSVYQDFETGGKAYFKEYVPGPTVPMVTVQASLRGYSLLPRSDSRVYPKYGIGAEAGYVSRIGLNEFFAPEAYAYVYGYLPGLTETQGLKLTLMADVPLRESVFLETRLNIEPRHSESSYDGVGQIRLTADYAIPVYVGDISFFSPVAYIRNFLAIPHVDVTWGGAQRILFSYGADLTAELANFAWMPFDSSVGVDITRYNGVGAVSGWYVGPIFSMDF